MIDRSKLLRNLKGGVFSASLIAAFCYVIYVINFYPIRLLCEIRINEVRLYVHQLQKEAQHSAADVITKAEVAAHKELIREKERWLPELIKASRQGFKEFLTAYWQYKTSYSQAKKRYNKILREAEQEAAGIKKEAEQVNYNLLKQVKEDFNALALIFKSPDNKMPVRGYLYDPETGEIIPCADLLKLKSETRLKEK